MSRTRVVLLAAVAAVGMATFVVASGGDDGSEPAGTSTTSTTSTTAPSSTTSTTIADQSAVWPGPGAAPAPDAESAARSFATAYLGMSSPVVGELRQGDARLGEIDVRPRADGPATTVFVRMLGSDDRWSVLGAATADIELLVPVAGAAVSSPVHLEGRALAFEGTVDVEVREDGTAEPLGAGFVTGGGDVMRAFAGDVGFTRQPTADAGAIVLFTRSAEDGQVWSASVVRIRFARSSSEACAPTPLPILFEDEMVVNVTFSCDAAGAPSLVEVPRVVPLTTGVLRATVEALLAGPTPEERSRQIGSWFSDETTGTLRSVDLDDGHAVVDFTMLDRVIPNASASAGSERLLAELDATVLAIDGVTSVEYRLEGSCDAFALWLQMDGCLVRGGGEEGR